MLPDKLKPGDTIGFFSPSTPITVFCPKRFERAKEFLAQKGYKLIAGKLTGKLDGYRSGSARERADELNELIRNPEVKCIMSVIGGYNSNSMLPYIDYDALQESPKIIVGYSDVTALLLGIYAMTGLTTFYGPALVASFGEFSPLVDMSFEYFQDIVSENFSGHTIKTPDVWTDEFIDFETQDRPKNNRANKLITVSGGAAEGRLIGGNLNTISGIWGSKYMPEIKRGDILFIEDTMLNPQVLERSFSHLKCCGVFETVSGIVLGKHELYDDKKTGKSPADLLCEVMEDVHIPILAEFDCCHTHPMLTLPIGANVRLDADRQTLTLLA